MKNKALFVSYKIKKNGEPLFFIYSRPDENDLLVPTGTCEKDEKPEYCAFREFKEELGQQHFKNFFPIGNEQVFSNNRQTFSEKAFALEISDKITVEDKEIESYNLMGYHSAVEKLTHDFHKRSLKICNDMLLKKSYYKIFILIGPGGSGKDTLQKLVINDYENISIIKTLMTREPNRKDDLITRVPVTESELMKLEEHGEIIEKNKIAGNWYASSYLELIKVISQKKHGVVNLDINGALKYKEIFSNVITIFIKSSLEEIEGRLRKRNTEGRDWIKERMRVAKLEIEKSSKCDYVITNNDGKLDESLKQLKEIIEGNI